MRSEEIRTFSICFDTKSFHIRNQLHQLRMSKQLTKMKDL